MGPFFWGPCHRSLVPNGWPRLTADHWLFDRESSLVRATRRMTTQREWSVSFTRSTMLLGVWLVYIRESKHQKIQQCILEFYIFTHRQCCAFFFALVWRWSLLSSIHCFHGGNASLIRVCCPKSYCTVLYSTVLLVGNEAYDFFLISLPVFLFFYLKFRNLYKLFKECLDFFMQNIYTRHLYEI